jgi:hypothetical protein
MALTEHEVAVANQALGKIGQYSIDFTKTTATSDNGMLGNVSLKCLLHFEQTRNALFRQVDWNFASERIVLVSDWATGTAYTTDQYVWVDDILYKCNEAHTSTIWNTDYVMDGDEFVMDGDEYIRDSDIDFKWDMVTERAAFHYAYKYLLPADFCRLKPKWLKENYGHFSLEGKYILTDEQELEIHYIKKVTDPEDWDFLFTEVFLYDLALKLLLPITGSDKQAPALKMERQYAMQKARMVNAAEKYQNNTETWNNARYYSGKV